MSFILDALRKSETARRRSEAPDLFTSMPNAVEAVPARTQWPMLAVGGVGVLSLIAALWLFTQREPSPTTADTGTVSTAPAASADAIETTDPASPAATSATPEPVPNTAPAAPVAPPPPIQSRVSPPAVVQVAPPPAPVIANPRDLPPPPQTNAQQLPAPAPTGDRIVSLADLDAGTRNQLPPLKLSMHLWNEAPSQRFLILDGQRLKEGDLLGEVVIERITRDGAVLSWRGSRLKIELR